MDRRDQLYEHGLGDVLGLVRIAQDAQHVAVDVVLVAEVEEADGIVVADFARVTACAIAGSRSFFSPAGQARKRCDAAISLS